jgi:hypothetical protein
LVPQPEHEARKAIDSLLAQAGWAVCNAAQANIHGARGIAIREFPLKSGHGFADYLLYVNGKAAGVIEAKPAGATLTGVEIQSAKYSTGLPENLPAWGRPLPFSYQSTGAETRFTNGLDPSPRSRPVFSFHRPEMLAKWIGGAGTVNIERGADAAGVYEPGQTFLARLQHLPALKTEGLWPAQIKAIQNLEQSLKENRPRALIQMGERRVKEPRTPAQGRSGVVVTIRWMFTPLNGQTKEGLPWACEWSRMRNDASAGRTTSGAGLCSEVTGLGKILDKTKFNILVKGDSTWE